MRIFEILRKHFLSGMIVLIPMAALFWIARLFGNFLWDFIEFFPTDWRPEAHFSDATAAFINFAFILGIGLTLAILISLLGLISKLYFGKKALEMLGLQVQKIPVLGTIYSSLDQFLKTIAEGGGKQFNRVVYLEYPRKGVWAVGFVTGPVISKTLPKGYLNVFVPTVPNPTAGFHLLVLESEVLETGMTVEEAFKLILSLGIAQTPWKN